MAEEIPKKLGKYQITRILGKGAMGVVYEGWDSIIERTVAIKTIHKALLEGDGGQTLLDRFKREAQAAGRLMHQNIVAIYEYGEEEGTPFIAMEYIKGKELKDYIKEQARFEVTQVVDIMTQTLSAMEYVHAGGVVHRDMKPANIILLENGHVKVADFGIARVENSTMTQMGAVMGTPSYMSPEQFMGQQVDKRADLFSMGAILYELLTGEKPFPGKAVATIMQKVLYAPVESPSTYNFNLPGAFDTVIKKALSKRPGDRFQNAKEFSEAIKLAADNKVANPSSSQPQGDDDDATMVTTGGDDEATMVTAPSGHAGDDEATTVIGGGGTEESEDTIPSRRDHKKSSRPSGGGVPAPENVKTVSDSASTKKNNTLLIVFGVVGLLVLAGGGFWFTQKSSTLSMPVSSPEVVVPVEVQPVTKQVTTKPTQSTSRKGTVNAISNPSGAVILVDGEFMGVTPHRFDLKVGEYQLTLKKDGFHQLEASLEVEADGVLDLDVTLDPL